MKIFFKNCRVFAAIIALMFANTSWAQQGQYKPITGDLLFQDLDCGEFCDAIEKVTESIDGKSFSHVGMVYLENDNPFVLEACGRGVVKTPLEEFLKNSHDMTGKPKVYVGRLKSQYSDIIPLAIKNGLSLLGKMYDDAFDIENDQYYCSELIYFSFADANGNSLFDLSPMTFIDPSTKKTFPVWTKYFKELGMAVPEGEPGINPGSISRSDKIEIVYRFY